MIGIETLEKFDPNTMIASYGLAFAVGGRVDWGPELLKRHAHLHIVTVSVEELWDVNYEP